MKINKKTTAIVAAGILVASAGGAYAYWTTTGSGSGTGSTTAGVASQLSFTQNPVGFPDDTVALAAMYPGDTEQTLIVRVRNTSTTQSAYVTSVGAYITTNKLTTECSGADFLIGVGAAASSTGTVAAPTPLAWTAADLASGGAANASSRVHFNNTTGPQNGCKGAVVTINYVAN